MSTAPLPQTEPGRTSAFIVYGLYLLSIPSFAVFALLGVIVALAGRDGAGPLARVPSDVIPAAADRFVVEQTDMRQHDVPQPACPELEAKVHVLVVAGQALVEAAAFLEQDTAQHQAGASH